MRSSPKPRACRPLRRVVRSCCSVDTPAIPPLVHSSLTDRAVWQLSEDPMKSRKRLGLWYWPRGRADFRCQFECVVWSEASSVRDFSIRPSTGLGHRLADGLPYALLESSHNSRQNCCTQCLTVVMLLWSRQQKFLEYYHRYQQAENGEGTKWQAGRSFF